jgi:hypothetical protein
MNEMLRLARCSTSQLALFAKLSTSSGNATNLIYAWNDTRLDELFSDNMSIRMKIDPLLLSRCGMTAIHKAIAVYSTSFEVSWPR